VAARLIDIVLHYLVGFAVAVLFGIILAIRATADGLPIDTFQARLGTTAWFDYVLAMLGYLAYHTFAEGIHGTTLGKAIVGITVRREDNRPVGLVAAAVRSVAFLFDGLLLGVPAAVSINSSPRQQRYGDKWARTVVVRKRELLPDQRRPFSLFLLAVFCGVSADAAFHVLAMFLKL
jgi:uncharacterized RDD family membrane protein YckC